MNTAIVIGATGLVGKCLMRQLLDDPAYTRVIALVRRSAQLGHDKYEEHLVDFDQPASYAHLVSGDVLFSTMGTTRGEAGSLAAQRKVDYAYQLDVAKLAARNGVRSYVLVSSSGANPRSMNAYLKMKGELERDVQTLGFASVQLLQPGPLTGPREKPRTGEKIGITVMGGLNAIGLFRGLRPISGDEVARAMRNAATLQGTSTHGPAKLFSMA